MKEIVDTNVILRFLVGDNEAQQEKASKWFQEAKEGKRKLVIQPIVVAEVCFVLEEFYKKERIAIASALDAFLSQKWFEVEDREILLFIWNYYTKNMHFVDSYLLAWSIVNKAKVLSFDKKLLNKLV